MENNVRVFSDGYEVIYSNSIVLFSSKAPNLKVEIGGLVFSLIFTSDPNQKIPVLKTHQPDDKKSLEMNFVNFHITSGTTLVEPLQIASLHGKKLFFHIQTRTIKDIVSATITFYLAPELGD